MQHSAAAALRTPRTGTHRMRVHHDPGSHFGRPGDALKRYLHRSSSPTDERAMLTAAFKQFTESLLPLHEGESNPREAAVEHLISLITFVSYEDMPIRAEADIPRLPEEFFHDSTGNRHLSARGEAEFRKDHEDQVSRCQAFIEFQPVREKINGAFRDHFDLPPHMPDDYAADSPDLSEGPLDPNEIAFELLQVYFDNLVDPHCPWRSDDRPPEQFDELIQLKIIDDATVNAVKALCVHKHEQAETSYHCILRGFDVPRPKPFALLNGLCIEHATTDTVPALDEDTLNYLKLIRIEPEAAGELSSDALEMLRDILATEDPTERERFVKRKHSHVTQLAKSKTKTKIPNRQPKPFFFALFEVAVVLALLYLAMALVGAYSKPTQAVPVVDPNANDADAADASEQNANKDNTLFNMAITAGKQVGKLAIWGLGSMTIKAVNWAIAKKSSPRLIPRRAIPGVSEPVIAALAHDGVFSGAGPSPQGRLLPMPVQAVNSRIGTLLAMGLIGFQSSPVRVALPILGAVSSPINPFGVIAFSTATALTLLKFDLSPLPSFFWRSSQGPAAKPSKLNPFPRLPVTRTAEVLRRMQLAEYQVVNPLKVLGNTWAPPCLRKFLPTKPGEITFTVQGHGRDNSPETKITTMFAQFQPYFGGIRPAIAAERPSETPRIMRGIVSFPFDDSIAAGSPDAGVHTGWHFHYRQSLLSSCQDIEIFTPEAIIRQLTPRSSRRTHESASIRGFAVRDVRKHFDLFLYYHVTDVADATSQMVVNKTLGLNIHTQPRHNVLDLLNFEQIKLDSVSFEEYEAEIMHALQVIKENQTFFRNGGLRDDLPRLDGDESRAHFPVLYAELFYKFSERRANNFFSQLETVNSRDTASFRQLARSDEAISLYQCLYLTQEVATDNLSLVMAFIWRTLTKMPKMPGSLMFSGLKKELKNINLSPGTMRINGQNDILVITMPESSTFGRCVMKFVAAPLVAHLTEAFRKLPLNPPFSYTLTPRPNTLGSAWYVPNTSRSFKAALSNALDTAGSPPAMSRAHSEEPLLQGHDNIWDVESGPSTPRTFKPTDAAAMMTRE